MAEKPSDLFKDLDSITKRFLANAREKINESQENSKVKVPHSSSPLPDSLAAIKERLRGRKPFGIDVTSIPDNFEARLGRIKQAISAPASEEEKAENEVIKQSAKEQQESINDFSSSLSQATQVMTSLDPSSPKQPVEHVEQPEQPSTQHAPQDHAPQDIVQSMAVLLGHMTGKGCEKQEYSWTDMDRFSAQLRKCWAGLLTSGDVKKAQSFLPAWSALIDNVYQSSSHWGDHATSWKTWAQNCRKECEILQMWLSPTQVASLSVPDDFKGQGNIPVPPKTGVPDHLVASLQHCADFACFVSQSSSTFFWRNTPQSHAFAQAQQELEQWVPTGEKPAQWKENALDCYAVLNAKLVLLATNPSSPKPALSSSPKKSQKPSK